MGINLLKFTKEETGLAFLLPDVRRQAGLASDAVRLPTAKLRVPTESIKQKQDRLFTCPVMFAGDGTRTRTPLRTQDFESSASTIPPLRQYVNTAIKVA